MICHLFPMDTLDPIDILCSLQNPLLHSTTYLQNPYAQYVLWKIFESAEAPHILRTLKSLLIKMISRENCTFFIQNTRNHENKKGKNIPYTSGKDDRYMNPFVFAKIFPATSQIKETGFDLSG